MKFFLYMKIENLKYILLLFLLGINFPTKAIAKAFFDDINNFKNQGIEIENQSNVLDTVQFKKTSKSLFWSPDINFSLYKTYQKFNDDKTQGSNHLTSLLQMNILNGGADYHGYKWQSLEFEREKTKFDAIAGKVELRAASFIFNYIFKLEELEIEKRNLLLKEETLRILNGRYSQGKIPLQEVLKAKLDYGHQLIRVRNSEVELEEHIASYRKYFVDEIKTNTWPFDENIHPKLVNKNISYQVEIQKISEKMGEMFYRKQLSGHFPILDFSLKYARAPIANSNTKEWSGVFTLTIPLWSKLETSSSIREAYNDWHLEKSKLRESERAFGIQQKLLEGKIELYRKNLEEAKSNLKLAKEIYQDFLKIFRNGKISFNDLVIEQNRLIHSEVEHSKGQFVFHQALVEYCNEMGESLLNCFE